MRPLLVVCGREARPHNCLWGRESRPHYLLCACESHTHKLKRGRKVRPLLVVCGRKVRPHNCLRGRESRPQEAQSRMRGYGGMACAPYADTVCRACALYANPGGAGFGQSGNTSAAAAMPWVGRCPPHGTASALRGSPPRLRPCRPVWLRSLQPCRPPRLRSLQPCPLRPSFSNMNLDS